MTHRPLMHQLVIATPFLLAIVLSLLAATPLQGGNFTYAPNVAWLMTLVVTTLYPPAWPRVAGFSLGILQDLLFGTPLGSQALLALVLAQAANALALRHPTQRFRLRWLEAAAIMLLLHLALWVLMQFVVPASASLRHLLYAGLVNALWYPLFYGAALRILSMLPDAK